MKGLSLYCYFLENLAFFKPTSQSSTGNAFISSNAVDGSRNTEIAKCTHTIDPGSLNPWWRVDLGQVKAVSELFIVNRNSNGDRLNGFNITVGKYNKRYWHGIEECPA